MSLGKTLSYLLLAFALLILFVISLVDQGSRSPRRSSSQPADAAATGATSQPRETLTAKSAAAEPVTSPEDKWSYQSNEDSMTSKPVRYAAIESENTVEFDFPYTGSQRGTLTLRQHPTHGFDVIFTIQKGQLLCQSYQDCQIRVRFDEDQPEAWSAVGPSDNSTTAILLHSESRFLQRLRKAKTVRIQVPVYQEGSPSFEFDVATFNHERFSKGQ
jgi:hypothetical protein